MKKALIFLLALLLLTGCAPAGVPAADTRPARELIPQTAYKITAHALEEGLTVRQQVCAAGDSLYFLADAPAATGEHTVAGTEEVLTYDVFESRLYRLSLADGAMKKLAAYRSAASLDAESYSAVAALFPGKDDTLWVMENTTHYIFDLPKNFDEDVQDKWEYYQYRGDSTVLRQLDESGKELTAFTLTNLQSSLNAAMAWGDYLLCAQGQTLLVLSPEGQTVASIPTPGWVTALLPMGDDAAILTDHEEDGVYRLYTLSSDMTLSEGTPLPTPVYDPAGLSGNTLYYTDRGNLFSWDLAAGTGAKLLDWQDYDRDRSHITDLFILEDGSLAALSQKDPGEDLELLRLTASKTAALPPCTLTLGVLAPDDNTMDMVLHFNRQNNGGRIRVADYSEYEALGQNGTDRLRLDLAAGNVPDLLFSADWYSPITTLASHQLEDLTPYLEQDQGLQSEGLMTAVLDALREEDGRLLTVAGSFHLSTTVGRADILSPTPLTVSRTALLNQSLETDGFAAVEPYTTRDIALQGHLSRRAGDYFDGTACDLTQDAFLQGLDLAALYPETLDWSRYEKKGIADGWLRVRNGNQLYLSGTYSSFAALAYDMNAVGENAILAGWPDTPGGHALEVWESWGMTTYCQDKDLAWRFLRRVLTEESQTTRTLTGLPTNRTAFQRLGRAAMQGGSTSFHPVGEEMVELSTRLTEAQYRAILDAVDAAVTLVRPVPVELAMAVSSAVSNYFTGEVEAEDVLAAAQFAATAFLNPEVSAPAAE